MHIQIVNALFYTYMCLVSLYDYGEIITVVI